MNAKMRKLLLDGNCLEAGIARGDIIVVVIPKQTKVNDKRMKKRSGILYGNTVFTDEQIIYFYVKHEGNASAASRELRMTLNAYRQRLAKLGLKPKGKSGPGVDKSYTDKQIKAAMKKAKNNMRAAAKILGCHYLTMQERAAKLGLKANGVGAARPKYTDKQIKAAMKKAKNNMSAAAKILGCAYWTMQNRVNKLGLKSKRR